MHFSAPSEGRQKSTRSPAGQTHRHQKAMVSIGFYNANPKPAKQVLSKLNAEMRFETPPCIFMSWKCVISDLCFRHWLLIIFQKNDFLQTNVLKTRTTALLNFGVLENVRLAAARIQIYVFLGFFIFDDTPNEIRTV